MQIIIDFLEYTLDGWLYFIYFVVMIIFSLACLGVVGDKVFKKREEELKTRRELAAQEEYKKAQETIDKQAHSYSVDNTLDPTAKKEESIVQNQPSPVVGTPTPPIETPQSEQQPAAPTVIVLDAPTENSGEVVDNITPIVDNANEEDNKEKVPNILVINEDGTSNTAN